LERLSLAVVSFRVPDSLREEMERISIDWPDVLRKIVEERILLEKRRRAAARMDASRKKTVGVRFNSTREIRKMRDAR
jgi:hypothetical protein